MKIPSSILLFSLLLITATTSCVSDPNENNKDKEHKTDTASANKDKDKTKTTPSSSPLSSRTSASSKINHKDVDLILMTNLLHQEINKVRSANNLPLLNKSGVLKNAATDQTNYQIKIGDISHQQTNSTKKSPGDRVKYYGGGFNIIAENVLYEGFVIRTSSSGSKQIITPSYAEMAKKMVTSWMNSPGHRKNIMNPAFTRVGTATGYHSGLQAIFATQVFGKPFDT